MPGQVGGVEGLAAVLPRPGIQRVELVADPVPHGEEPALREQAAFLGEEQEHHPHHHGDRGLVDLGSLGRQRIRGAPVPGGDRRLGHGLHEQFDRAPDLRPQGLRDLRGRRDRICEQLGQPVLGPAADEPAAAQQLDEGVPGGGELDPPVRVKDAGRHHGLRPGADNRPPAPVGDDSDEYPAGAEQFLHPVYGGCRPAVSARVPQRVHWVGDQDQRTGQLSPHQRAVRPDGHRVVGGERTSSRPRPGT